MKHRVALVTGGSSGIGMATARELKKQGFSVYACARRTERMQELENQGIHTKALDVTSEESMNSCVEAIIKKEGRIDVLINNAGYGSYGAIEDVTMEEARRQVEVNLFGLARMTQLVLPQMRKQHSGKIVNISSMGGRVWTGFGGWYHTTKYAVEGFSHCLRIETAPFGIHVIIIEPGVIATDWGTIAADHLSKTSAGGAYVKNAERTAGRMRHFYSGKAMTKPETIALCIGRAVTSRRPRTRYLLGFGARPAVIFHAIFGDRIYDWLIQKIF